MRGCSVPGSSRARRSSMPCGRVGTPISCRRGAPSRSTASASGSATAPRFATRTGCASRHLTTPNWCWSTARDVAALVDRAGPADAPANPGGFLPSREERGARSARPRLRGLRRCAAAPPGRRRHGGNTKAMSRRIYFDGLNLSLERGTGIATYTRILAQVVRDLGHEIGIVYGSPTRPAKNPLLREISFFDTRDGEKVALPKQVWDGFCDQLSVPFGVQPSAVNLTG